MLHRLGYRSLLLAFLLAITAALTASAQTPAGRVMLTAGNVLDSAGSAPLATGQLCALTTDYNDIPMGYSVGGGGQTSASVSSAPCTPVVAGVATPMLVINSALSNPRNACIRVSTRDGNGNEIRRSKCVQTGTPASMQSGFCATDGSGNFTCNWDKYSSPGAPNMPVLLQPGPQGTPGNPGSTAISTANGSNGNWTLTGIATFQSACRSIEDAHHICITSPPFYGSGSTASTTLSSAVKIGDTSIPVANCIDFAAGQGVLFGNIFSYTGTMVNRVVTCSNGTMIVASQMANSYAAGSAVNHDNTNAFQTAINLLPSVNSLHIMGPQGTYLVNGQFQDTGNANAVLVLPPTAISSNPATELTIEGDIVPTGLGQSTGLILETFASNGTSGQSGAFIRGKSTATPTYAPLKGFTATNLTLKNARLRNAGDNTITMLDGGYLAALDVEHVFVDTGAGASTDPRSVGIIWPGLSNDVRQFALDVTCVGYQTCYKPGEHFQGTGLNAADCGIKVLADGGQFTGYPANSNLMSWSGWSQNCGTVVKSGANPTVIDAHEQLESVLGYGVDDAPNLLHGAFWFAVPYNQGAVTKYSGAINGASWLQMHNLQFSVNEGGFGHIGYGNITDIGWKIASFTDGSGGSSNVFVQLPPQHVLVLPQQNLTSTAQFNGYQTNALAHFTGSSLSVRVLVAADAQNPQGLTSARFLVGPGSGQYFGIEVTGGNTRLMNGSSVIASRAYSSSTDKYWRIRESGGTLYADTSGTGDFGSWKNLGSLAPSWSLSSGVLVQLEGGSYGTVYTPGLTDFSEFQFGAGQTVSSN